MMSVWPCVLHLLLPAWTSAFPDLTGLPPQREVETAQLSIDGRGDTQNVVHADGGIVLSQEKGRAV